MLISSYFLCIPEILMERNVIDTVYDLGFPMDLPFLQPICNSYKSTFF